LLALHSTINYTKHHHYRNLGPGSVPLSEPNIATLNGKGGGKKNPLTFGSRLPSSFHRGPTAAAGSSPRASSGAAAERPSWRSGDASAIAAPGRAGRSRSRGHATAGRRREGRRGDPPGRRIRVCEGEAAGVEMSRSMGGGD